MLMYNSLITITNKIINVEQERIVPSEAKPKREPNIFGPLSCMACHTRTRSQRKKKESKNESKNRAYFQAIMGDNWGIS